MPTATPTLKQYLAGVDTIVFDAYGTLFDTGDGSVRATARILEMRNQPLDATALYCEWKVHNRRLIAQLTNFVPEREIFALGLRAVYDQFGIDGDPAIDVRVMLESIPCRVAFADVADAMNRLQHKAKLFVASNSDHEPLTEIINRCGLRLQGCYSSEVLRAYKPHPQFYRRLLEAIGADAHSVLFVGDSVEEDVRAPMRAGMKAVLLDRQSRDNPRIDDGFHRIHSLIDLCLEWDS